MFKTIYGVEFDGEYWYALVKEKFLCFDLGYFRVTEQGDLSTTFSHLTHWKFTSREEAVAALKKYKQTQQKKKVKCIPFEEVS